MIAADVVSTIRKQVAESLSIDYVEANRIEISTPFLYSDGDHYGFYLFRDQLTGSWKLSDDGECISKARYQGVDLLSANRVERLRRTTEIYGLDENDGELTLLVKDGDFGRAFYLFSQACFEVSRLAKVRADRGPIARTYEPREALLQMVKRAIPVEVQAEPHWHHTELDPHRIYAVDFYLRLEVAHLVFVATNDNECIRSTISCQHYRQNNMNFKGIGVADESTGISKRNLIALRDAMTRNFGPEDEEELAACLRSAA